MKRRSIGLLVLVALLVTGVAVGQSISALPGGGWWTSAGIQNVGTGTASVILTAYDSASSNTYTANTTIVKDGSVTFLPGGSGAGIVDVSPALPGGFSGSMVLSSDQPLVAIGQLGNNVNGSLGVAGGFASGMYRGKEAGSSTISFPTAKSNFGGKTSTFYIQATGVNVTAVATVRTNNGVSHTKNMSISANKSVVLNMSDFAPAIATTGCGSSANTSPCLGALTIVASAGTMTGVALETDTSTSPATRVQVASTFAPADASTTLYCPVFKNAFTSVTQRYTGITVQNVSGGSVNIFGTFTASQGGSGTFKANTTGVVNGGSYTFSAQASNVGGFPAGAYGSAVITATGNIIAAVNEANFNAAPFKATTYTCFSASSATTKIAFPQVKENFGVNTTGVSVQNVGAANTTINATYTCSGVTYTHVGVPLVKGATYTYFSPSSSAANWSGTKLPNNKLCAVVVTAGQPIVGVAQEAATTSLDTKNYEGFNLSP